jgi:predicted ester cyclase
MIEAGDRVVGRNTVTGTHRGGYMGIPPTGKTVTYNEIFIFRFAGAESSRPGDSSTSSRR